jgi:hypothetical protein
MLKLEFFAIMMLVFISSVNCRELNQSFFQRRFNSKAISLDITLKVGTIRAFVHFLSQKLRLNSFIWQYTKEIKNGFLKFG